MPPKEKPSKKAVKEKQARVIDDSTFGLKNKNKSKKVQQFIDRVEKTVKFNAGAVDAAKAKEAKKDAKLAKQLQEEELRQLFNEGISNQFGKKKSANKAVAAELGLTEVNKDVARLLEDFSSDEDSDEDGEYRKEFRIYGHDDDDDNVAIEVFREKTIEDIIEEQREKLAAEGKQGTPVTADSFAKWRTAKLAQRQADAEARMRMEQNKKKGGKGLSILTGKELFNYNSSLFVDDEGALDASEESALNQETQEAAQAEEDRAKYEAERAQAEQMRLSEMVRLEEEENERQDEERRVKASASDRETFVLGDVTINKIVFDIREVENLEPFPFDDTDDEDEDDDDGEDDDDDEEDDEEEGEEEEDDCDDENDDNDDENEADDDDDNDIETEEMTRDSSNFGVTAEVAAVDNN